VAASCRSARLPTTPFGSRSRRSSEPFGPPIFVVGEIEGV
jgi:hypothetical protein